MCLDNWKDAVVYSSRDAMTYSNLDFKVTTCDPNNLENTTRLLRNDMCSRKIIDNFTYIIKRCRLNLLTRIRPRAPSMWRSRAVDWLLEILPYLCERGPVNKCSAAIVIIEKRFTSHSVNLYNNYNYDISDYTKERTIIKLLQTICQ